MDPVTIAYLLMLKACTAQKCTAEQIYMAGQTRESCIVELEKLAQSSSGTIDKRRLTFTVNGKTYRCVPKTD